VLGRGSGNAVVLRTHSERADEPRSSYLGIVAAERGVPPAPGYSTGIDPATGQNFVCDYIEPTDPRVRDGWGMATIRVRPSGASHAVTATVRGSPEITLGALLVPNEYSCDGGRPVGYWAIAGASGTADASTACNYCQTPEDSADYRPTRNYVRNVTMTIFDESCTH
jgi:hypothetical protein